METLPRIAIYAARAQLVLAALALLAALGGGIAMQLELLAPGPRWSADRYAISMLVHGIALPALGTAVLAGGVGYAALARFVGARLPAPAIGWVGVGLWAIGLIATIASWFAGAPDTGWTFYTPAGLDGPPTPPLSKLLGPLGFAAAALVYGLHLGVAVAATSMAPPIRRAIAGAMVIAILWGAIDGLRGAFAVVPADQPSAPAVWLVLILVTMALAGAHHRGTVLAAIATGCGAIFVLATSFLFGLGMLAAAALIGLWIALAVIGGFGRPVVAFAVFGIGLALLLVGLAHVIPSSDMDLIVHDTHVEVGLVHLGGAILLFGMLGAGHAFARREPHPVIAWCGALVATTGIVVHGYASVRTGAMGMPRRYWDYDPQFEYAHVIAGAGAAITLLGLAVVLIGWLVGRRPVT